jgi:hypothetical protein
MNRLSDLVTISDSYTRTLSLTRKLEIPYEVKRDMLIQLSLHPDQKLADNALCELEALRLDELVKRHLEANDGHDKAHCYLCFKALLWKHAKGSVNL